MAHQVSKREWAVTLSAIDGSSERMMAEQQRLFRLAQAIERNQWAFAEKLADDGLALDTLFLWADGPGSPHVAPGAGHLVPEHLKDLAPDGLTLLGLFAAQGHADAVRWLITRGACTTTQMAQGRDAAWLAMEAGAMDIYECLKPYGIYPHARLQDGSGTTRLIAATCLRQADMVSDFLKAGAAPNAYDTRGRTALHHNFSQDPYTDVDVDIARLLLDNAGSLNMEDEEGVPVHALAMHDVQRALMDGHTLRHVFAKPVRPTVEPLDPAGETDPSTHPDNDPAPARAPKRRL